MTVVGTGLGNVYKSREGKKIQLSFYPVSPVWADDKWFLLANESETKEQVTLYCQNFIELTD